MLNFNPRIEVISTGDELVAGLVVDTNGQFFAGLLEQAGFLSALYRVTTARDDLAEIASAISGCVERQCSLIVLSGGMGFTPDDFTLRAAAVALNVPLVPADYEPAVEWKLAGEGNGGREGSSKTAQLQPVETTGDESRGRHVLNFPIPRGGELLFNPVGTCPGVRVQVGECLLFMLSGVPDEFQAMVRRYLEPVIADLAHRSGPAPAAMHHGSIRVLGLTEVQIAALVDTLHLPGSVSISYRVDYPEIVVGVRFSDFFGNISEIIVDKVICAIKGVLGRHAYGSQTDTLPVVLGRKLAETGSSVGVAESCTGGMLGQLLTEVPGASRYFPGGMITYSSEMKVRLLGVTEELLAEHGVVSSECAQAMARGVLDRVGVDWAMAVTGIAGPGGGTAEYPVGTVYMAVAGPSRKGGGGSDGGEGKGKGAGEGESEVDSPSVWWVVERFEGNREQIRRAAAFMVMWNLFNRLMDLGE